MEGDKKHKKRWTTPKLKEIELENQNILFAMCAKSNDASCGGNYWTPGTTCDCQITSLCFT